MGRTLNATVIVGEVAYLAGSVPPDDVAEQITNPAAWAQEEDETPARPPRAVPSSSAPAEEADKPAPVRLGGSSRRPRQS